MLTLHTKKLSLKNFPSDTGRFLVRLSSDPNRPIPLRRDEFFLSTKGDAPSGYRGFVVVADENSQHALPQSDKPIVCLPKEFSYLRGGDVARLDPAQHAINVLYRRNSPSNSFLVTERCNHLCLMCSQPPREVNDGWIIDEILEALPLVDRDTKEIGFTGGEPTLLGDRFLEVLVACKHLLPRTAVHLLSNGRTFSNLDFAKKYAAIEHPDLMVGIPLYSDVSTIHDYVVQSDGAYDETLRGILNLKRLKQRVEIRVVLHQQTYSRLPMLAEFLARNLTMVDHVALMGLEMTGFTRANLTKLWVDPWEYRRELREAVLTLSAHRMHVSIYNHQLCTIDPEIWPFARRSISDWKNEYVSACEGCAVRNLCGGFFATAKHRFSDHITPFAHHPAPLH